MKRIFAINILLAILVGTVTAQNSSNSPISHLYNCGNNVAAISWDGQKYLEPHDTVFKNFPQQLIRNKKGLFLALNGSGILYKANSNGELIDFQRQDSTIYFGDNFNSFIFSFRDTIYSLGGYGYWTTKGFLRYYVDRRHEWEVVRLNKEIPFQIGQKHDLLWYDLENGIIYFVVIKETNSTTTESTGKFLYNVFALDLSKREWKLLGTLSLYLKNNLTGIFNIVSSPFGQFAALKNENIFLDFSKNRIYRLSDAKQRELELLPTSTGELHVNYFIDSTFYTWLSSKKLVDSMTFSKSDLVLTPEKIYTPGTSTNSEMTNKSVNKNSLWLIILLTAILAALIGYYSARLRSKKTVVHNGHQMNNGANPAISFTSLELEIIICILNNSSKGNYTSIEEVNKTLGVGKKTIEVQKKQRSDVINSINRKYSYIKRAEQELIEKRRTEFDKRSFEYFIDVAKINEAVQITKDHYHPNNS